ncbi:MAG: uracil-DNA glycosylase [Clostridia bacterium]|nr:uracil-DNA glycosylase [Clostridia bacterium]
MGIAKDTAHPEGQGQYTSLAEIREVCLQCRKCKLRQGCRQVVFGRGNPEARLMFVGEGPGEQEDIQGLPFVGKAGQLLDKIIEAAGFSLEEVYIGNIVKCRPPGNRVPTLEEARTCMPWLMKQIQLIRPKIMVCLGSTAVQGILDPSLRITKIRGRWAERNGILIMPTYHPAALLRDESKKRPVWEDFKQIRKMYLALAERECTAGNPIV